MASNNNDPKSKLFQLKIVATSGLKVVYHVAFVLNETLYIHGGLLNKNDKKPCNNLFKFDFQSGWNDITPVNSPSLSNHCAVVQEDYVLFIGGWNGNNRISDVYAYDTKKNEIYNTKTTGFPVGAGLSSHTCNNLSDNSIIIFGREGSLRIQKKYGNCFLLKGSIKSLVYKYEELDVDTASRSGHTTMPLDKNNLIVIGGRKDKVTEIHKFSTNEIIHDNLWKEFVLDKNFELKKIPGGRRFAAVIKIGDFCLVHAGETFDSHFRAPQQDLIILQLSTMKWFSMGDCGISLQNHTISCVNKRLIIVGGLSLNNKINENTYELCLNDVK